MSSQNWSEDSTRYPDGVGSDASPTAAAKDEARDVARTAAGRTRGVAGTATQEARNVAGEAGAQVKVLAGQLGHDLKSQAGTQQQRAAEGLRSISSQLSSMAEKAQDSGPASQLVRQVGQRADDVAGWLEDRDPAALLEEVRGFARRRPAAFLAISAGAGLLAGRLTRGLTGGSGTSGTAPVPAGTYPPLPVQPAAGIGPETTVVAPPEPSFEPRHSAASPAAEPFPPTTLPTGGSPSFPNGPRANPTGDPLGSAGGYDETEHHKGQF